MSGRALSSQSRSRGRRPLMPLTFQVAIRTGAERCGYRLAPRRKPGSSSEAAAGPRLSPGSRGGRPFSLSSRRFASRKADPKTLFCRRFRAGRVMATAAKIDEQVYDVGAIMGGLYGDGIIALKGRLSAPMGRADARGGDGFVRGSPRDPAAARCRAGRSAGMSRSIPSGSAASSTSPPIPGSSPSARRCSAPTTGSSRSASTFPSPAPPTSPGIATFPRPRRR